MHFYQEIVRSGGAPFDTPLAPHFADDLGTSRDSGEALLTAAHLEAELFVVKSEGGEDGGVEVAELDGTIDSHESEIVRGADPTGLYPTACHPDGEAGGVVLAAGRTL